MTDTAPTRPAPRRRPLRSAAPALVLVLLTTAFLLTGLCLTGCFRIRPPAGDEAEPPAAARTAERGEHAAAPAPRAVTARGDLAEDERATIELFRNSSPSVVYITTLVRGRDRFSLNLMEIPQGSGSGFVWDEDGHVVTNYHVVAGVGGIAPSRIQVTLADRSDWDAKLVGVAPSKDLAVLQVEAPLERLRPIPVGRSADLAVGQKVFAIGNPFGLDQTLTTGVVSALGREIDSMAGLPIRDVVQTDAAINPGNSGGPLLDSAGRLIGVNAAILSPSGAYAGIGFAIPADTVAWVVPELIEGGELRRPSLGIDTANDALARQVGIDDGVLVLRVAAGSSAADAGVRPTLRNRLGRVELGDVVVAVDGEPVSTTADLLLLLERHQSGDTVQVTLRRGDRQRTVDVVLGPPA